MDNRIVFAFISMLFEYLASWPALINNSVNCTSTQRLANHNIYIIYISIKGTVTKQPVYVPWPTLHLTSPSCSSQNIFYFFLMQIRCKIRFISEHCLLKYAEKVCFSDCCSPARFFSSVSRHVSEVPQACLAFTQALCGSRL